MALPLFYHHWKFRDFLYSEFSLRILCVSLFVATFNPLPSLLALQKRGWCWSSVINNFIILFTRFQPNMTIKPEKWNGYCFFYLLLFSIKQSKEQKSIVVAVAAAVSQPVPVRKNHHKDNKLSLTQKELFVKDVGNLGLLTSTT